MKNTLKTLLMTTLLSFSTAFASDDLLSADALRETGAPTSTALVVGSTIAHNNSCNFY